MMAEEAEAAGRVQQLEQQLATLQAKLQKSDTVKKKLREHLALLKEKAINSLALVEEQVLLQQEHANLQQQYEEASAAALQLQQAVQAAETAKRTAEEQYHAALQGLKATEGKLRSAEKNFNSALKTSMKAQQAVKERDEALAGMKTMQQQIQQLQLAVRQLQRGQRGQQQHQPEFQDVQSPPPQQQQRRQQQKPCAELTGVQQQQLMQKVKQLEVWVQGLHDIDIEIDVNDMYSQLQRSVLDVLNAKIDSRLDGLQQRLAELQQQQTAAEATPAAAASTAAAAALRSPLDRPATQRDVQQLQQQMEALAAQQQHWHTLMQRMLADRAATATGGMHGLHQDESCFMLPAVASAGPTREASPAVAAAFGHSSGAVAASSEAVATAVGRGVDTRRNAAAAAGLPASTTTGARGSSMFGTTALVVGGTNSSFGDARTDIADRMLQAGSPSIGTAPPHHFAQQQKQTPHQEQLIGEKRQRQECQEEEQEQELDPWDAFLESSDMQLQLPDSETLKQQQQQWQDRQGGTKPDTIEVPGKRARAAAVTATATAAAQLSLDATQSMKLGQCTDQQQQELMKQLQAVRAQQAAVADVAQQLAEASKAGKFNEQLLLDGFAACFLMDAAPEYDASQLQQVLAALQEEQQLQTQLSQHPSAGSGSSCSNQLQWQQQLLGQLSTAGWAAAPSCDGGGSATRSHMFEAQQHLAECACKLFAAMQQLHGKQQPRQPTQQQQEQQQEQQQQQQPCATEYVQQCSNVDGQEPYQWPALAECWQAEQVVPTCSCCSSAQQYCSGTSQLHSSCRQGGFVCKLACHVMAPVYKSVSQLGAAVLGEQQQGMDEQQQQSAVHLSNVAHACAAAAAAAHLYKAAGDRQRYLQLIARLLSMTAAYTWPNTTSSNDGCEDTRSAHAITACRLTAMHTDAASEAATAAPGEGDRRSCGLRAGAATAAARQCSSLGMACLLAAAGAWPVALRFGAGTATANAILADAGMLIVPTKHHCMLCSSKRSAAAAECNAGSHSCLFWQWLVLDPALVAVRACLQHVAGAAAAGLADSQVVAAASRPKHCDDSAAVQQIAAVLQRLLRLIASAESVTRSTAVENAKEIGVSEGSAGNGCIAVGTSAAAVCLPAPDQLLGCLLGILQVLLQKQPAGSPPGQQISLLHGAGEAATATFCAAGSFVALFVPQQTVTASLKELRRSLGGDVSTWPVHVQWFLARVAVAMK